ncbi:hypothetical protein DFQ28_008191 [Apophysomyces sp. BC1034]|nr:hypothetical protein DFQ28_008191 [Apophysomyces sp. BC1034]
MDHIPNAGGKHRSKIKTSQQSQRSTSTTVQRSKTSTSHVPIKSARPSESATTRQSSKAEVLKFLSQRSPSIGSSRAMNQSLAASVLPGVHIESHADDWTGIQELPPDQDIERLFDEASDRLQMKLADLPLDKKWWILCNENEFTKLGSVVKKKQSALAKTRSKTGLREPEQTDKLDQPEDYIKIFIDKKGVTLSLVSDLALHLKTMPIRNDYGRFDAWLRSLEAILDGRGKTGALTNKAMKLTGLTVDPERRLTEYALASILLVNAIVDPEIIENASVRITLRNQLHQSGLTQILDKMSSFDNELLNRKIYEFKESEELDSASIYGGLVIDTVMDPEDVLEKIVASISGTRAYGYLKSILQHLLMIQCGAEKRNRYYQLIESIVSQIVLDRKGIPDDFSSTYGFTVDDLISKFAEQDRFEEALKEAREAKETASKAIERQAELKHQVDLKADGLVGKLQAQNESLENALSVANQTNAMLHQKLSDIEAEYQTTVQAMDAQIKRHYDTVRQQTEYGSPTEKRRRHRTAGHKQKAESETRAWSSARSNTDTRLRALSVSSDTGYLPDLKQ